MLSRLRDGELDLTPHRTSVLLQMVDTVRALLTSIEANGGEGTVDVSGVVAAITAAMEDAPRPGPRAACRSPPPPRRPAKAAAAKAPRQGRPPRPAAKKAPRASAPPRGQGPRRPDAGRPCPPTSPIEDVTPDVPEILAEEPSAAAEAPVEHRRGRRPAPPTAPAASPAAPSPTAPSGSTSTCSTS